MSEGSQASQRIESFHNEPSNTESAIRIRLETDKLLNTLDFILRGYREKIDFEDGEPVMKFVRDGENLANDLGIQSILGWVRMVVNPQVVQGNFDDNRYTEYLCRHRKAIATNLMLNIHRFNIKEENYAAIMDLIMSNVEPFMSRLINNQERKLLTGFTSTDNTQIINEKNKPKLFNR